MMIFRNSSRNGTEFCNQWRKSHLMTSWKDCTNKRIRESEKLKTVLELYNLEIHQKKAGPDYHRLKTMMKRSIEQNLRIKNFETRNGNYERNAGVKNQGTKQRGQRTLGDCWQWKANGQCSKGDNCSFRHDINKRPKTTQPNPSPSSFTQQSVRNAPRTRSPRGRSPSGRMARLPCKAYLKGSCNNSFCEKWHPPECLFCKSEKGCRFGEKCSHAHRQVEEQPSKRSEKNGDKSAVAFLKITRQLGCESQDLEPPASSSAPYLWGFNLWISDVSEHTSPHVMSESQTPAQDQRCQSRPSARNSFVREEFLRIMGPTNNDCRFQILILTNSPRQQNLLVGR